MVAIRKEPKVAVIISTYNGEKYIKAQLDSILQQSYRHIDIYIRDDGSTDGTVRILRQYAKKHHHIHLLVGDNLGYAPSFFKALSSAKGYDYYAFCDQDDVWSDTKIQRAVESLLEYPQNQPLLYGSSYDYYDAELNYQKHATSPRRLQSFAVSTTECFTPGTCMVFNPPARELLLSADASKIYEHDRFVYMICVSMGKVIYDPTATIKYRRTGNNASPCGLSFFQLQVYRVKNFLTGPKLQKITRQNQEFARRFLSELNPADQKTLALLVSDSTLPNRLHKALYPHRWRGGLFDELSLRLLFILGKM